MAINDDIEMTPEDALALELVEIDNQRVKSASDIFGNEEGLEAASINRWANWRIFTILTVCLLHALFAAILMIFAAYQQTRKVHSRPMNLYLANHSTIVREVGGWADSQTDLRFAATIVVLCCTILVITQTVLEHRFFPNPTVSLSRPLFWSKALVLLAFAVVSVLFMCLTIIDSIAVGTTSRAFHPVENDLPSVTCCGVKLNTVWVHDLLVTTGMCYQEGQLWIPEHCTYDDRYRTGGVFGVRTAFKPNRESLFQTSTSTIGLPGAFIQLMRLVG